MWQKSWREDALPRSAAGKNMAVRIRVGVLRATWSLVDTTSAAAL
jgi:hypothetical protein